MQRMTLYNVGLTSHESRLRPICTITITFEAVTATALLVDSLACEQNCKLA